MESQKPKESISTVQTVSDETQDPQRAARFWERTQKPGLRASMMRNIETAVSLGSIGIFTKGNPEEDAEEMAAYRTLAQEMGCTIDQFKERPGGGIATARIEGRRKG